MDQVFGVEADIDLKPVPSRLGAEQDESSS